jgi:hypothetical protein
MNKGRHGPAGGSGKKLSEVALGRSPNRNCSPIQELSCESTFQHDSNCSGWTDNSSDPYRQDGLGDISKGYHRETAPDTACPITAFLGCEAGAAIRPYCNVINAPNGPLARSR